MVFKTRRFLRLIYALPIEEFIGRKDDWKGTWEYEKMMNAYNRVRKATGIPAGQTNRN